MQRAPLAACAERQEGGRALALSLLAHAAVAAAIVAGLGAGKGSAPEPPGDAAVMTVMFAAPAAAPAEETPTVPFAEPDAPAFTEAPPEPIAPMPEPDIAMLPALPTPTSQARPFEPARAQPQRAQPRAAPAPQRPAQAAGDAPAASEASAGGNEHALPILITNPGFRSPPRPPAYPQAAVARGLEGTVLVRVLIAPDGTTREVVLHRSSGAALLDRAALEAVRHWAFMPAAVGGRAVPAWVEVPVRFRLG
jgi:protein TonB